jgi:zinc D-Ala-D-Ala carboxypeptidase
MTRVSPHFTFAELTTTDHRAFLAEQADPPAQVRANLVRLGADLLEPALAQVGPLRVNSGYRCPGLNAAIGGSETSAHMEGLAADVVPLETNLGAAFEQLALSGLPLDQLIFEFGRWIHIGAAKHGRPPRGELLMIFEAGRYEQWRATDPRFRALAPVAPAPLPNFDSIPRETA